MRQIVITNKIVDLSRSFYTDLIRKGPGRYQTARQRLVNLEASLRLDSTWIDYADYVHEIVRLYPIIIKLRPFYYESFHKRYFARWDYLNLSRNLTYGGKNGPFYKILVERMRYEDVRSTILLPYISRMGIKTCAYCNAQYATTFVSSADMFATYDMDHYYPQSKYPYLSTSFFNLIPSCASCNRVKGDHLVGKYPLYVKRFSSRMKFELTKESIIKYHLSGNAADLQIYLRDIVPCNPSYADEYNEAFRINKIYSTHKDEVEELIWKSMIYNESYCSQLKSSFRMLFPNNIVNFPRLYLGVSNKESDILKRPLSKMKQDVARQLKLI